MKKFIRIILISIETILIFVVVGALSTAITKNVYSQILIQQFKSKATFIESKSSDTTKIYEIASEEEIPPYQNTGTRYYPGAGGDILISLKSEITIPFVGEVVSFFAGGHASIVLESYQDCLDETNVYNSLEATGLIEGFNYADTFSKDYWVGAKPYKEVIGLRVKTSEEEKKIIQANAMAMVGDPYNYSFIVDTKNKSYCSDLISKVYNKIGINLNKDGFTTSVYDLLVSKETYIAYYHYFDYDGVKHIYYLS